MARPGERRGERRTALTGPSYPPPKTPGKYIGVILLDDVRIELIKCLLLGCIALGWWYFIDLYVIV